MPQAIELDALCVARGAAEQCRPTAAMEGTP